MFPNIAVADDFILIHKGAELMLSVFPPIAHLAGGPMVVVLGALVVAQQSLCTICQLSSHLKKQNKKLNIFLEGCAII